MDNLLRISLLKVYNIVIDKRLEENQIKWNEL